MKFLGSMLGWVIHQTLPSSPLLTPPTRKGLGTTLGPASANQRFSTASQASCHVHCILCWTWLNAVYKGGGEEGGRKEEGRREIEGRRGEGGGGRGREKQEEIGEEEGERRILKYSCFLLHILDYLQSGDMVPMLRAHPRTMQRLLIITTHIS